MLIVNPPHLATPEAMLAKADECDALARQLEKTDPYTARGHQRRAAYLRERAALARNVRGRDGVRFG